MVAGTIRHAGRRAAAGAQAVRGQVEEGARALGREALDGAQAAAAAAEDVAAHLGGDMLGEWVSYAQRAYIRNTKAMGELVYCRTPLGLLRWQSNLFNETLSDFTDTNARVAAAGVEQGLAEAVTDGRSASPGRRATPPSFSPTARGRLRTTGRGRGRRKRRRRRGWRRPAQPSPTAADTRSRPATRRSRWAGDGRRRHRGRWRWPRPPAG